jgi:hypothetical protein
MERAQPQQPQHVQRPNAPAARQGGLPNRPAAPPRRAPPPKKPQKKQKFMTSAAGALFLPLAGRVAGRRPVGWGFVLFRRCLCRMRRLARFANGQRHKR